MKKLAILLFIGSIVLGNLPVLANTNSTTETANIINMVSYTGDSYRIYGDDYHEFRRFVNRGHADIVIVGDGSTDLDLYVYIGGDWEASDSPGDDEKVCLSNITRSGYITIRVVNRGRRSNNYTLFIK